MNGGKQPSSFLTSTLALLLPLGLFALMNLGALDSWWAYDDPCLLRSLAKHGTWVHFVEPTVWRGVSGTLLMPWTLLSFGLDYHLFGLDPVGFYAHHLLSFALLITVGFFVLRRFLAPSFSALALCLFVVSVPSFVVAQQLMNRSYVEGLVFTLASVALFHHSLVFRRLRWALAGALAYALATTSKEIFVPLVVILPFLPVANPRTRLTYAAPYVAVAIVYTFWRTAMLIPGQFFTSYGDRISGMASADQFGQALGFDQIWQLLVATTVLGGALVILARGPDSRRSFLTIAGIAMAAPLLSLGSMLSSRHLFVLVFACCIAIALALQKLLESSRRSAMKIATIAFGIGLIVLAWERTTHAAPWLHQRQGMLHYRAEGSFLLGGMEDAILMTRLDNVSYLGCMRDLAATREVRSAGFCGDPCFCANSFPRPSRWAYDGDDVVRIADRVGVDCTSTRPIEAHFTYDSPLAIIRWRLGPHANGRYSVMLVFNAETAAVSIPVAVPPQGEFPLWLDEPLGLLVKYESPEGWTAYSPVQWLQP